MAKKKLNYKKAFEEPMKIKKLTDKHSLKDPIPVERAGYFMLVLILLLIFGKDFMAKMNEIIPGSRVVILIGVPILVSGEIVKLKTDGKALHEFLFGMFEYYVFFKLPKKRLCNDAPVKYIDEVVVFEKATLRTIEKDSVDNVVEVQMNQKQLIKIDLRINKLKRKKNKLEQKISNLKWRKNKANYARRKNKLVIKKNELTWKIEGLTLKKKLIAEESINMEV